MIINLQIDHSLVLNPSEFKIFNCKTNNIVVDISNDKLSKSTKDNIGLIYKSATKVGCDIERLINPKGKVALFTSTEQKIIVESSMPNVTMTKIWTIKEAVLKYYRIGFKYGINSVEILKIGNEYVALKINDALSNELQPTKIIQLKMINYIICLVL